MRKFALFVFILSLAMLGAVLVSEMTGFALRTSGIISAVAAVLIYLMLDLRPKDSPDDTVIRLTRGNWYRKK
jgi:hypothetical protein